MTYEEFKELALNPPRRDMETIFKVVVYSVNERVYSRRSHYPKFELSHRTIGYYHSVDDSEKIISEIVGDNNKYKSELYCFYIKEYPVGVKLDCWEDYGISMRLYDSTGKLVDHTYCSGLYSDFRTPYGLFRGREEKNIRFKEGDIVEVREDDEVRLAVILSESLTIERCWELRNDFLKTNQGRIADHSTVLVGNKSEKFYMVDACDDQSAVFDEYETHSHIHTLRIMPLHYPISDKLRQQYICYYKAFLEEEERDRREIEEEKSKDMQRRNKVVSLCGTYQERQCELNPKEALRLLADCYIEYCGISLGLRTIAYDAAEYWMQKLAGSDDSLATKAQSGTFMSIIPLLSPDFANSKDILERYDIAPICLNAAINGMEEFLETLSDDKLKIALSTGFIHIMKYYKDEWL